MENSRNTAMDKLMSVMVQVTILVLLMVSTTMGATTCPPPEDAGPSMDEILYYSDVVVLGEVLEHYKDPQDPAAYTAEMEVYCVYKGHHVPSLINITKAGAPSDACFKTEFEKGEQYLTYLRVHDDDHSGRFLTPAYPHNPSTYKDELYIMCDINITYPVGTHKDTAKVTCEDEQADDYDYDYPGAGEEYEDYKVTCIPAFVPSTDNTEETGKEIPYHPSKVGKVEDEEGGSGGSVPLCMSLVSLALVHAVVLMFS